MKSMLEGIRVLDFTANVSGPAATVLLADMGAEVIKIERSTGEDARIFPPYKNGFSAPFVVMNRGKKAITLDLKTAEGNQIFRDLVAESDVLVENYKPGVMKRLGLDYDTLTEINPKLIMLSLSGYGQYGPLSSQPAYDSIIQAITGLMDTTGFPDGPPVKPGTILVDLTAAMQSAFAITSALFARERTGQGEYFDISMFDVGINLMAGTWTDYTVTGNVPTRSGNKYPYVSPFDTFNAKDGYFMICSAGENTFQKLCEAMGKPEIKTDSRFDNLFARVENEPELKEIIEGWTTQYTIRELEQIMIDYEVPGAPVLNVKEAIEHPHTKARQLPVDIDQPGKGIINIYGPAIKARNSEIKARGPAPEVGQNNETVLREILGKNDEEIEKLKKVGAMGPPAE